MLRAYFIFVALYVLRAVCRIFFTPETEWVGDVPEEKWRDYHLIAILNHTSLYEFVLATLVPSKFLRRLAFHGVIPIASKTMNRPLIGPLWKLVAANIVSISRERDDTWKEVLSKIDRDSMVVILPEGRMKRANGLDSNGRPMTVRAGIADILKAVPSGRLLLAYSRGLHHVQIPGERFPRLFKKVGARLEELDIETYREDIMQRAGGDRRKFTKLVIEDLTARRDRYCHPEYIELEKGAVGMPSA